MKKTMSKWEFVDEFMNIREDNFSRDGLSALYDWLCEYEDSTGQEMEFDPIALCCDFTEYESLDEFNEIYSLECESIDDINDHTLVIPIDDESFIIQDF